MIGRIGSWRILRQIGRGGTAEVYQARDDSDGAEAAVKVLLAELAGDKRHVRALEAECAIMRSLDHKAIPRVLATGEIDGRPAFAMGLLPGVPLHRFLEENGRFDRIGCWMMATKILAYVHGQKLVHGDVKAENFIVSPEGRLGLVDFGNAERLTGTRAFTRNLLKQSVVQGTPSYLAPELLAGKRPSFASDVYALGVLAFYLLSRQPPFVADSRDEMLRRARDEQAPGILTRQPALPRPLAGIIDRCLLRDPSVRFPDASALHETLRAFFARSSNSPQEISRNLFRSEPRGSGRLAAAR